MPSLELAQQEMLERNQLKKSKKSKKEQRQSDLQLNARTQKVFSVVMENYRFARLVCSPIQSVNYSDTGSGRQTRLSDKQIIFIADVETAMKTALSPEVFPYVLAAYGYFDLDEIEIERLASKVLHGGQGRAQSLKHRCAREFQRRGIYPLGDYMKPSKARS